MIDTSVVMKGYKYTSRFIVESLGLPSIRVDIGYRRSNYTSTKYGGIQVDVMRGVTVRLRHTFDPCS